MELSALAKLSPEQQASVLAAPYAVRVLANNGQEEAVKRIQRSTESWRTRVASESQQTDVQR